MDSSSARYRAPVPVTVNTDTLEEATLITASPNLS